MLRCKKSCLKYPHSSRLLWAPTSAKVVCAAPAYLKKEGAIIILECAGIACNMMGVLIGAMWCGLVHVISVN